MAQISPRRGFLDFSPIKECISTGTASENKENTTPILSLIQFSRAPFLTFGTVKLGTSKSSVLLIENPSDATTEVTIDRIASTKGFSVAANQFTVQPRDYFSLTISWTPTEEGGVRELIIFSANGVVKHQAVLLGRAEAIKKKKRSLWDSIKNKNGADLSVRSKKLDTSLKTAVNKTFHVSRKPQYKREKPRSPLAPVNDKMGVREKSLSRCSPVEDPSDWSEKQRTKPSQRQRSSGLSDQTNALENSPVVFLVPAIKVIDSSDKANCIQIGTPEQRELVRLLNRTLSPVGTPDRLKNLMPCIQSVQSTVTAPANDDTHECNTVLPGTPVLSVRDALALIESDLTHVVGASPPNACSSFDFSDSLESANENIGCGLNKSVLKLMPDSPVETESNLPRLTFFVTKPSQRIIPHADGENAVLKAKRAPFTSATVTKSKAVSETVQESSPGGRKIKTSRRRLLEKTLELSDGKGIPALPVIDSDVSPVQHHSPAITSFFFEATQLTQEVVSISPPLVGHCLAADTLPCSPLVQSTPLCGGTPQSKVNEQSQEVCKSASTLDASSLQPEMFPVHVPKPLHHVVRWKKRKSDEFLKDAEKGSGADVLRQCKRSRVSAAVTRPRVFAQETRSGASLKQRSRTTGSVRTSTASSLKATSFAPVQAKQPTSKPTPRGARSLKSFSGASIRKTRVVAVAQSQLTFIKSAQTAIPRHPMPFVAKNMFYDERWIEKQERGFTWWINYVLTPDDFKVDTEVTKVNAVSLAMGSDDKFNVPKAPTKEEMSFSTYTARRRLNRLRRSACQLFTSDPMVKAIQRLEIEVEAKRLLVRKDRHLWKDIGERQKVLNWLLSYNPLWLRIGLETIYGEMMSLESNSDVMGLALFILRRLLWNPDLAAQYRHANVPHLYKDGHEEALSRFTLKKLLLLVCFLDKAKESRLIEHDPCLFCMNAEFKTSKDLLLAFSRDFLSGEGILPRHLGYLGLPVSHIQTPLDEFNFAVKNLAADLKCGVRLVRVMELFIQDWSLSRKLRMPAISRLQKVHNVDIALQVLKSKDVDLKDDHGAIIESRDIVDGHREKTLTLLWKIIFAFQVEVILDEDELKEEISFLKRTWRTKQRLASLRADKGVVCKAAKPRPPFQHSSHKITLLMEWVNAVSEFYNLKVENFTVSFSDGRALCYLIHHYHPSQLPFERVRQNTTQTVECSPRGRVELNCSSSDSENSFDGWPTIQSSESPSVEFKELLENEKDNFRLVNSAVSFLGGVPAMINPADMSNTIPNEKVVMSYLSFLCARLLDLRNETRAARVIQGVWRKYRLRKDLQLYQERSMAAAKIQVQARAFLRRRRAQRQNTAAVSIQAVWRGYAARNALRLKRRAEIQAVRHRAAILIQAHWRRYISMRNYQCLNYHVTVVQAQWRMKRAVAAYRRIQWASAVIQNHTRALALAKTERGQYLSLRFATVQLQRSFRRRRLQKRQKENRAAHIIQSALRKWHKDKTERKSAAALKIQTWYRTLKYQTRYIKVRKSAALIQACYRGYAQRRSFQILKLQHYSATVIQSAFRAHAVRQRLEKRSQASVTIQRWFRASLHRDKVRQRFVSMRSAAVAIQAACRGHMARTLLKSQHQAATMIQASWRKCAFQRKYRSLKKAAIVIQQKFKAKLLGKKLRKEYVCLKNAAQVTQAVWRGRVDRKRMEKLHKCATRIQACYRRHMAQTRYRSTRAAALVIQRLFRAYRTGKNTRKRYLRVREAATTLQAGLRGMMTRKDLRRKYHAATVIQSAVRAFVCRKRYALLQSAAIIIQSHYRARQEGKAQRQEYRLLRQAAVKLQAASRGFRVRKGLKRKHQAATVIQAQFRMYKVKVAYLATKCAALIIQERYRANKLRDEQAQQYKAMKSAAVVIQAAHRGHRVRVELSEMHKAAAVIQRKFLSVRFRKRFLAIKRAAILCQRRYRAVTMTRKQSEDFQSKRRAAMVLQAAFRGVKVRQQLHRECMAAVTIQSHLRKHLQRTYYKKLQQAASTVQAHYRALKLMREEMQTRETKRTAAVVLQAAFRGMKSRQYFRKMRKAACVFQRAFRASLERKRYLTLRSSVLAIQQRYQATVAAKQQMQKYQKMRVSAILLQAVYRGQRVRKQLFRQHGAATVIQAAFRKHKEEVKFQAMQLSAIIIQRFYRSCVQKRRDRERFLTLRRSAVVIQAAFRAQRTRRSIAKLHRAATTIQSYYKKNRQLSAFKRQRWAACVFQQRFRALRQRDFEMQRYQQVRNTVILLQAAFRGMKSRQSIKQRHQVASVIQRAYRAYRIHKEYLSLKSSVVTIQQRYRATVAAKQQMQRYQEMRVSASLLQAAYRGQRVRKQLFRQHGAATVIQAAFRKHKEEVKFQAMQLSAIIIQRFYRSCVQKRRDRERFLTLRQSAVVIQAAFRARQTRRYIAKMHGAASTIQAQYKMKKQLSAFRRQRWAACVLQHRFRAQMLRNLERQKYQQLRNAAVCIQASFRGNKARQLATQTRAATKIQSFLRMSVKRRQFLKAKWASLAIQAVFRGYQARAQFRKKKASAFTIQRWYRSHKMAERQRREYVATREAAVKVQSAVRGYFSSKRYQMLRRSAVTIQACYRGMVARRLFQRRRASAFTIQKHYKAHLLCQREKAKFTRLKKSALLIQTCFRGHRARREFAARQRAVVTIHRCLLTKQLRKRFLLIQHSVKVIQGWWRGTLQTKEERKHYLNIKVSAVTIQAVWRGHQARQNLLEEQRAAVLIQSCYRSRAQRRLFQRKRAAALVLQGRLRALLLARAERDCFLRKRHAAVILQAHFRGWIVRKKMQEKVHAERRKRFCSAVFHHLCAARIQRAMRAYWTLQSAKKQIHSVILLQRWIRARRQRTRYLEDRSRVVTVQKAARRWLARRHQAAAVLQQAAKRFLLFRHQQRVQQGIVKAQALWRGHRSRMLRDNPKVVALRHRLRKVSTDVQEENRLCNKMSSALDYLLQYKHFSYILEALKNLETATRLSPECCERLVESGATRVIFTLIRSCNRSIPCMEVISYAIQILLNLSKYNKTIEAVYAVENSVDTLLDLLQIYREKAGDKVADKGGSIFTKACFLLAILLLDQHRALEVRRLPKALDRIRSLYRLTARKHKMDAQRTVVKQKMSASINGSFFAQATPRKSKTVAKFAPDWVLRKDKLKDVVDPLQAIQMLADAFSIVL